jgi:probable rRNA maturation factor
MKINKNIVFFYEQVKFKIANPTKTQDWIKTIIREENCQLCKINIIFCSDQYLHKINLSQLNHDTFTDIITFNHSTNKKIIEGDIYISIDRVLENSELMKNEFYKELYRVISHGILHLIGYNDHSEDEIKTMRYKEDQYISKAPINTSISLK